MILIALDGEILTIAVLQSKQNCNNQEEWVTKKEEKQRENNPRLVAKEHSIISWTNINWEWI